MSLIRKRRRTIDDLKHPAPKRQAKRSSRRKLSASSQSSNGSLSREYLSNRSIHDLPESQKQLLIHAPKENYCLKDDAPIPSLEADHEILVRVECVGLNPIDWKGPAFGFGLPSLPCVLGRDFVGTVVKVPRHLKKRSKTKKSSIKPLATAKDTVQLGDTVLGISTDYRDYRKAAFQQFVVASTFNVCRLPRRVEAVKETLPATGVAFVTAALTLGVCLGLDFSKIRDTPGPDLYKILRSLNRLNVAEDIRSECFDALSEEQRIHSGDWLAIWGGSSTVGYLTLQLAKKAGLKVICVADSTKHGSLLVDAGADVLVHRAHPEEAVDIVRCVTQGKNLRYGVDTVGSETANLLQSTFQANASQEEESLKAHMVCLVASPKSVDDQGHPSQHHKVPMKLFHESPEVGSALMTWMEDLLNSERGLLLPKTVVHNPEGLEGVNGALEKLRTGELLGQRIVVRI